MRRSFPERGANRRLDVREERRRPSYWRGGEKLERWELEEKRGRGGRIGANVDSNPRPRWAIDRKIYLEWVNGADSSPHYVLLHPPPPTRPATFPRKSLRLTFCPSSAQGIKFDREAVSNILCSGSATPRAEYRVPPSRRVRATLTTWNPVGVICAPKSENERANVMSGETRCFWNFIYLLCNSIIYRHLFWRLYIYASENINAVI